MGWKISLVTSSIETLRFFEMNRLNNSHAITDADPMKSPVHQQPYFEQNSPQFRPPTFQSTPQYRFNNQDQYSPRQFHSTPRGHWQNRGRGRGHNNYKKNFDKNGGGVERYFKPSMLEDPWKELEEKWKKNQAKENT